MGLRTFSAMCKTRLHNFIGRYPRLYRPVVKLDEDLSRRFVRSDSKIVIDGYPRSANTFAYHAFRWAQEQRKGEAESMHIGHHVHQPAHILRAVEFEIPVVLLIRNPIETVLSYVVRHSEWLTVKYALRSYVNFYKSVLPVKDQVVIGVFAEVTQKFGHTIRRVNEKWGEKFHIFNHTVENEKIIFRRIEGVNARQHEGNERKISRPSAYKEELKEKYRSELSQYEQRLEEAQSVYNQVIK